jgi:lia operon protein LiaG
MGKILKVGLLLFVIGLIGTVTLLFSGVGFANNKVIEKQTLIGNGLKKVSIHSDLADVIIHPANDDEVKMELTGNTTQKLKTTFQPSDDGETLNISVKQKDKFFFNINFDFMNSNDVNLNVYLPQKYYDSLEISTNLGDISTDYKLTAKNAIIKTEMGDVQLNGFEGEKIIGKTALGEIEIKELNAAFDIQSEKGDVNLQSVLSFSNENKIKTALGDVEVGITEDPEGLALDLSTELGDIESDTFITDAIKSSGDAISNKLKGQYGKNIKDGPSLTIKAEMGDITLKK